MIQKQKKDLVVLVHGIHGYLDMQLGISFSKGLKDIIPDADDFKSFEQFFIDEGYDVNVFRYTPMGKTIETLKTDLKNHFNKKTLSEYENVYFVTHSLGGIITHEFLSKDKPDNVRGAVHIASPFSGSPMADFTADNLKTATEKTSGEVALQISRKYFKENPMPQANYPVAVITGDNPGLRFSLARPFMDEHAEGPHDGLVSIKSAGSINPDELCVVDEDHVSILHSRAARQQALNFIKTSTLDKNLEGCRFPQP